MRADMETCLNVKGLVCHLKPVVVVKGKNVFMCLITNKTMSGKF